MRTALLLAMACRPPLPETVLPESPVETADTSRPCCGPLPEDTGLRTRPIPRAHDTVTISLRAPTTVYAVRHAEKSTEGEDPGLTEEGEARAEALAVLMAEVPLTAIYATTLRRTQDTVRPTAEAHSLPINIEFDPEDELADHILAMHQGETVLHAGHSYTLGQFMDGLGVEDLPDGYDYGDLWIITILPNHEVRVIESHYGD